MNVYDKYILNLEERRQRILDGKINGIPINFPRFKMLFPAIEKRKYAIVTANQKVGKSKLSDKIYMYDPFFYAVEHPELLKLKVLYFTLEMGKQEKFYEFLSHLLWKLDKIRCDSKMLKSVDKNNLLPQNILDKIKSEKYQFYIHRFYEIVEFIDTEKNPTGIFNTCKNFARSRGRWMKKNVTYNDGEEHEVNDYFQQDDEDEYWIIILDNYSNLASESGLNKMQTIDKMSKYAIELRDDYNFHIVAIQHQMQAQESLENRKSNSIEPSPDGLADKQTHKKHNYSHIYVLRFAKLNKYLYFCKKI